MAKVLVACEYSGKVRDAFRRAGHDAVSCDLLPTDVPGPHYQGDVLAVLADPSLVGWDEQPALMVAHPPCTFMANSGVRWLYQADGSRNEERWANLHDAADFFSRLWNAPVPRVAIENPVMHGHARALIGGMRPTQTVQPYEYGHGESKRTGLYLRGLPKLTPTDIVEGREQRIWKLPPSPDRWKQRSETFDGIAQAMADQWGPLL